MEKLDFGKIGADTVANEPERSAGAEAVINNDSPAPAIPGQDTHKNDSGEFEANAYDLVPSLIEGFASVWRTMWGKGEGADLTGKEKEGLTSLLQRGCEHFGLVKAVRGSTGFFIALAVKLLGITVPRAAREETRKHFISNFLTKEEKEDGRVQTDIRRENEVAATSLAPQSNGWH